MLERVSLFLRELKVIWMADQEWVKGRGGNSAETKT
jgi:hypothetical protein